MDQAALDSIRRRLDAAREKQADMPGIGMIGAARSLMPSWGSMFPEAPDGNVGAEALKTVPVEAARDELLHSVGRWATGGLAAGLGVGGLQGLLALAKTQPVTHQQGPATVPLPYVNAPRRRKDDEEEKAAGVGESLANWFKGTNATSSAAIPWGGAAKSLAVMGGAGLGYYGIRSGLNAIHEHESEQSLDAAREAFNKALLAQHPRVAREKHAADGDIGAMLDVIFDRIEKQASGLLGNIESGFGSALSNAGSWAASKGWSAPGAMMERATGATPQGVAGWMANHYGAFAAPAALITGKMVYDWESGRGQRAILDKALKDRERERQRYAPPEILALPVHVPKHHKD